MKITIIKDQLLKRRNWILLILITTIIVILINVTGKSVDLPYAIAQHGEFVVDLKETGKLRAENSVIISSPPARGSLQIIDLIPEGSLVQKGDFLIQFDTTDIKQRLDDQMAELDITKSNLTREKASIESNQKSLEASVESARASYRLTELRMELNKFEADVRVEEGKLNLLQADLSLKQALGKIETQRQIDKEDLRSLKLKIRQAELDIEKTLNDLKKLTLTAPSPGLVVYKEMWRGGEMTKVKVGDTPWRGMALIELPDLSVMQVESTVSEVDVAKIELGQEVEIVLDAYPEPTFHGEIVELASMAHNDNRLNDVKVFDIIITINESNKLLKPGMSANARIFVERSIDKTWVPIEAIFRNGGDPIVFKKSGRSWEKEPVILGSRNDNFVIIDEGIEPGDIVSLIDPTKDLPVRDTMTEKYQDSSLDEANNSNNNTIKKPRQRRNH